MARDFEDIFDLDDLSDDELRTLVRDRLADYETLDPDNILVTVEDGVVHLAGRVGTETERRIAEHVLTDVIGVTDFQNELVVDAIRRDEEPEAIDDHLYSEANMADAPLGGRPETHDDEAAQETEDLEARLYGTHDMQRAIGEGVPWEPPDSPTQEGLAGMEGESELGEDH